MLFSNLEYIPLRVIRRFLLSDTLLLRFGVLFPYYRINLNQADFAPSKIVSFEPYVRLAVREDQKLLSSIANRHRRDTRELSANVSRLADLRTIPNGSIDLILSSSVLEHVSAPPSLFSELDRVLSPEGAMLHVVDYRDHFFKYPYHFLQFSKATWNRWLNPGDLPGWRIYDHLEQMNAAGFTVRIVEQSVDRPAFEAIAKHISRDYRRDDGRLEVARAALWARKGAAR
jgi:SAM-dependent methyltransferase